MMELIVLSAPEYVANEPQVINRLFDAGLKRLHLRKPGWNSRQLSRLLMQIDQAHYRSIALHQHHQLADSFGIRRLHYTEQHRAATSALTLKTQTRKDYVLSTSVHSLAHMDAFGLFDYVFFGPVFNSISKPGYNSILPPDFSVCKNTSATRVIALGGVNEHNLNTVQQMNFDGAAASGSIWCHPQHAVSSFKRLQQQLRQNQASNHD